MGEGVGDMVKRNLGMRRKRKRGKERNTSASLKEVFEVLAGSIGQTGLIFRDRLLWVRDCKQSTGR